MKKTRRGRKKIKTVLDANFWISYLLSKKSFGLPKILCTNNILICLSEELRQEILRALNYVRIKKRVNSLNFELITEYFEKMAIWIEVKSKVSICRDPNDNFLLALTKDSSADYLITNDKDLLVLERFHKAHIVTFKAFTAVQDNLAA